MSAISRADADDMTPSSRVLSVADAADALATAMVAVTEMDAATISRVTALASTPAALATTAWMLERSASPYSLTEPERLNDTATTTASSASSPPPRPASSESSGGGEGDSDSGGGEGETGDGGDGVADGGDEGTSDGGGDGDARGGDGNADGGDEGASDGGGDGDARQLQPLQSHPNSCSSSLHDRPPCSFASQSSHEKEKHDFRHVSGGEGAGDDCGGGEGESDSGGGEGEAGGGEGDGGGGEGGGEGNGSSSSGGLGDCAPPITTDGIAHEATGWHETASSISSVTQMPATSGPAGSRWALQGVPPGR